MTQNEIYFFAVHLRFIKQNEARKNKCLLLCALFCGPLACRSYFSVKLTVTDGPCLFVGYSTL